MTHILAHRRFARPARLAGRVAVLWDTSDLFKACIIGPLAWLALILLLVL